MLQPAWGPHDLARGSHQPNEAPKNVLDIRTRQVAQSWGVIDDEYRKPASLDEGDQAVETPSAVRPQTILHTRNCGIQWHLIKHSEVFSAVFQILDQTLRQLKLHQALISHQQ